MTVERRFPRVAAHHSLLVKKLDGDALEEFATTRTIAVGGCSFISDEPLGIGSRIELLIAIDQRVVKAQGSVIYENPLAHGRQEVGVEFSALEHDDAEVIEHLFEKLEAGSV